MKRRYYIQIAVLIIIVLVLGLATWLVIKSRTGPSQPASIPGQQNSSSTSATSTGTPSAAPVRSSAPASGTITKITITSPAPNAQWVLLSQNTIQWNQAAGVPDGTISLLNASTGAVVGWIQQHISPHQTFFPWNTGSVFLSQTSALTENVPTGRYRIALAFDSPSVSSAVGPVFSIISPAETQVPTATITIQGISFSSSSITMTQGTILTFINRDATSYGITVSSRALPFTIGTSTSQTFDTSILPPGDYVFYSTAHPSLRLAVIIK